MFSIDDTFLSCERHRARTSIVRLPHVSRKWELIAMMTSAGELLYVLSIKIRYLVRFAGFHCFLT